MMTQKNNSILELEALNIAAEEIETLLADLDRAELGAMVLQVKGMVGDLREMLARRRYSSQVAIAAAALNQARQTLEGALKSMLEENTVGIEVSTKVLPEGVIQLRIEEVK